MSNLLMISGDRSLAEGKHGAFYNTLGEFHKYWDRIDIIMPKVQSSKFKVQSLFGNVFIHPSPWPLIAQPLWILKKGRQIYKEQKFNLMTVHEYPPFYNGIGARLLWNKIKAPYVLEVHHIPGFPKAANVKERFYKNLTEFLIRADSTKAKVVRAVNKKQVPEFLIRAGVPKDKIVYAPSFYIDLDIFKPLDLPKEYDLIFVGRLTQNKGIDLLLGAIKEFSQNSNPEIKNINLLIVGDGPLDKKLKAKIEKLKIADKITFYGWAKDQNDVAKLINQSKILVMPSYNEGGPRVVLEAMACGVPVLATPVGLIPDLKESGYDLSIKWESEDITKQIVQLLNDPASYQKYNRIGLGIAKKFEKRSAIRNYAENLLNFIAHQ